MGESAAQLRRDIENTRMGLGETVEAIGDRVSPGRMMERRKNRLTLGLRDARDRVMGMVDEHRPPDVNEALDSARSRTAGSPMLAGAVAFGTGFLLAAAFPPSRTEKEATEQLMRKAQPLTDEISRSGHEMAEHLKEPAQEALEEIKDSATESAHTVADRAKDAADRAGAAARGDMSR